ncbi:beta-hydroxyacyl-ACP dehydratase [Paenibacillus sp. ISL-20]|uniref:3-hydroxyacyl-ACP dehydratase FabZ family protein n=1 Tax=Paenibacillus sp. ISL-20 TaxID=2819163 RepID=UPI00203564D3|nr:beta-hydroxyacyl-ACP dehydratase [Paenibacillus sp. ISL-20]
MSFDEIRNILPQSFPFIYIDVVEKFDEGVCIVTRKNVSGGEHYVQGHFPNRVIYPGVYIIEGMAQSAILLHKLTFINDFEQGDKVHVLSEVNAKFLHSVAPGDTIHYECNAILLYSKTGMVEVKALVRDKLIAKAELKFAVVENINSAAKDKVTI